MKKQKQPGSPPPKTIMIFVMVAIIFVGSALFRFRTVGYARMKLANDTSVARRGWTAQNELFITDWTQPFCKSWSASDANNRSLQPYDEWFTHHPDMIVNNETDDEFCVELQDGDDETKAYVR